MRQKDEFKDRAMVGELLLESMELGVLGLLYSWFFSTRWAGVRIV